MEVRNMNWSQILVHGPLFQNQTHSAHRCPRVDITINVKNWEHIEVQISKESTYPGIAFIVL